MKNLITGLAAFVIVILLLLTLYTIQGKTERKTEIQDGITTAMEAAGQKTKEEGNYTNNDEFQAAFIENLMLQMDSDSDISVTVLKADYQKGILSAEVTSAYKHPNGNPGRVSCKRTIILDQQEDSIKEKNRYSEIFYLDKKRRDEDLYKKVTLTEESDLIEPQKPEDEDGRTFSGWINAETGEKADFSQKITSDVIFYADWR